MKGERVKLFFFGFFLFLLFLIFSFIISYIEYSSYKKNVNHYLYGLVTTIKEKYPSIGEYELIQLLNGKENGDYLEELRKYGILEDSSVLYALEKNYYGTIFLNGSLIFSISFVFLFFFFWYFLKKEREIKKITNYMREINHRNYILEIGNNEEGELSILRNEVYKTTILLREESENLKNEKEALKDTISDISHQLKTPLTSILILLDNILDNPNMDNKTKNDFIENVHHQVETINFLLVSMLKLSRLNTGIMEFKKEKIDCKEIINQGIKNVEILKEINHISIILESNENIFFLGDYHWELEALTNILKNAIEHSFKGATVLIKVEDNPLFTKIIIQDFGKGMSKKDLQNLFKRFYKGENSRNDSIGIGLHLAKKIVEKDGGFIKVDSKLGEGTSFEIRYMK